MRRKKIYYFCLIALIGVSISACNVTIRPYQSGDLLFVDDFETKKKSWNVYEDLDGSAVSYFGHGLAILVNDAQVNQITTIAPLFSDTSIKVTAQKIAGPDNNLYGIICRYLNERNYYGLMITSDGYYGIFKLQEGNYLLLSDENLSYTNVIRQGKQPNLINAQCYKERLSLIVNGELIAEVSDDSFLKGGAGLFAGSYESPGVAVFFDNFVVMVP